MAARNLLDVADPALVAAQRVGRQADELDAALSELGALGERTRQALWCTRGVKSSGCEKRTTHLSPTNSWKSIGPLVVSAWKLGAVEPRRRLEGRLATCSCIHGLGVGV